MKPLSSESRVANTEEVIAQLRQAAAAKKCWGCGCLHGALAAIERTLSPGDRPSGLDEAVKAARETLTDIKYDCLGCEICYPSLALNALDVGAEACPAEAVQERSGFPPLPGNYRVLKYRAPVAICTLTDEELMVRLAKLGDPDVSIIGAVYTENLGIERLIQNVLANPNIRFLVVCGLDSRQAVGHLPGQSLIALAREGMDAHGRIASARGKRPVLRNITPEGVAYFRRTVEVVDRVGVCDVEAVRETVLACAARNPGPCEPFSPERTVNTIQGYVPQKMVSDPSGYFVIYADRTRGLVSMEHYANNGVLDVVIEGATAAELYIPAVENGLISRLDHAAYLGRELARAESALASGEPYIQDAAPERALGPDGDEKAVEDAATTGTGCGCGTGTCHT